MQIYKLSQKPELLDQAIQYFWKCWGNDSNLNFYTDCIKHSLDAKNALPKFYIVVDDAAQIVASYALITNDLISRQDLMPWFACLFVNEDIRGQGWAEKLLSHSLTEAKSKGYKSLYLSTDLVNFYERKGWTYLCEGYNFLGDGFKIYKCETGSKVA